MIDGFEKLSSLSLIQESFHLLDKLNQANLFIIVAIHDGDKFIHGETFPRYVLMEFSFYC